jgi:hypothetical protein
MAKKNNNQLELFPAKPPFTPGKLFKWQDMMFGNWESVYASRGWHFGGVFGAGKSRLQHYQAVAYAATLEYNGLKLDRVICDELDTEAKFNNRFFSTLLSKSNGG